MMPTTQMAIDLLAGKTTPEELSGGKKPKTLEDAANKVVSADHRLNELFTATVSDKKEGQERKELQGKLLAEMKPPPDLDFADEAKFNAVAQQQLATMLGVDNTLEAIKKKLKAAGLSVDPTDEKPTDFDHVMTFVKKRMILKENVKQEIPALSEVGDITKKLTALSEQPKKEEPKEKTTTAQSTEAVHSMSTVSRLVKFLGVKDAAEAKDRLKANDTEFQKLMESRSRALFTKSGPKGKPEQEAYLDLRERLEGPMPIPEGINFTDKTSIDSATNQTLAAMLGVENKDEAIKAKLKEAGITEQKDIQSMKDFVTRRILLKQHEGVKLGATELAANIDKDFENLQKAEAENDQAKTKSKGMPEALKKLMAGEYIEKEQRDTLKGWSLPGHDSLYVVDDEAGRTVVMEKVNEDNIKETVNQLKDYPGVAFNRLPAGKQLQAEAECIRASKFATFNGAMGSYSKCRPKDDPKNLFKFYKNIEKAEADGKSAKPAWYVGKAPTTQNFVQSIVDNDDKTLQAFWKSAVNTPATPEDLKKIGSEMTNDQVKTLDAYYKKELKALEQTKPKGDDPFELAKYERQKEKLEKEWQALHAAKPDYDEILGEAKGVEKEPDETPVL